MGNLVAHDVIGSLSYLFFIYTLFFFINLKVLCGKVILRNAHVLDKELNLLWLGVLGMVFDSYQFYGIFVINILFTF